MPTRRVLDRLVVVTAVVWTGVVCVLSLTPSDPSDAVVGWDKARHAGAYSVVSVLWLAAFALWRRRSPDRSLLRSPAAGLWLVTVAAIGLGGALEILQSTVASRSGEVLDAVADAVGAVAGLGVWLGACGFVARTGRGARLRSPLRSLPAAVSPPHVSPSHSSPPTEPARPSHSSHARERP